MNRDTIVAALTPPGAAALSVFAVMGPRAVDIVQTLFDQVKVPLPTGRPAYGWFGAPPRDDVVVTVVPQGAEPCVEVSCHGGVAILEQLIGDVVDAGAKRADWRTLERRRGRSDFQCDALEALAGATTARTTAVLLDQWNGALDCALAAARTDRRRAEVVLSWSHVGRILERPARVVLFGLPNAGKSTLFNALVGYARVITSPVAGTTRDLVCEIVALDGWPIELVDGAGVRDDASPLEAEGMRRLAAALENADLRILVVDAAASQAGDEALVQRFNPQVIVANKTDMPSAAARWPTSLACSAATGAGVGSLQKAILEALVPNSPPPGAAVPFRQWHRDVFNERLTPSGA